MPKMQHHHLLTKHVVLRRFDGKQLKNIAEKFTKAAEDKAAEAEKWKSATAEPG
jgi:hypothetical protein